MSALTPRPGIMKIAPYVPGKDSVEGKKTIAKLSSNEGALGPSPKAMAAYAKAATELHRYPTVIRAPCARRSAGTTASTPSASSAARAPTSCSICWCAPTAVRATSCCTASSAF